MEMCRTYASEESLQVGDVVQLVYDKEGYVIPIAEVAYFGGNISVDRDIILSNISADFMLIVMKESNNIISINLYNRDKLIWVRNIAALTFFNVQGIITPTGVFIMFRGNGIISINNNVRIDIGTNPEIFITGFSLEGNYLSYNTIRGDIYPRLSYDNGLNQAIIYGTNDKDLYIGNKKIISNTKEYIYTILLTPLLTTNIINYTDSSNKLITQSSFDGNSAFLLESHLDQRLSIRIYNRQINSFSSVNMNFIEIYNIAVFRRNVFILGKLFNDDRIRLQLFDLNGNPGQTVIFHTKGSIIDSDISYSPKGLVIYTLEDNNGTIILSQYNTNRGTQIWSINNVQYPTMLSGSNNGISLTNIRNVYLYFKRLPSLIGVVSSVLYNPNMISICLSNNGQPIFDNTPCTNCPNGFNKFLSDTGYICCPINPGPDNPLTQLTVVNVDFNSTFALAPLIPGAEYYLNDAMDVVTQPTTGKYIGTAIDSKLLLIKNSF